MKNLSKVVQIFIIAAVAFLMLLSMTVAAQAEKYPDKDITFINPFKPGGSTDPLSRAFAKEMEKILGVNVNVINKSGAAGTIGFSELVKSKPDGYTIGYASNSITGYQPLLNSALPYKTPDDYQVLVKVMDMPAVLVVKTDAPWKTFKDFMADVKKNPGKIRCAVSGVLSASDMAVQELNKVGKVKIVTVPFSGGTGESIIALLGGRIESLVSYARGLLGHVQAGKIRPLAVFKKGPYYLFPKATPTYDAGYDATLSVSGYVVGPKGMPKKVVDKLVSTSLKVLKSKAFTTFCKKGGYAINAKGPKEASAEIFKYMESYKGLIKFLGIKKKK